MPAAMPSTPPAPPPGAVNVTLHRGMALLEILARSGRPLGVSELAMRTETAKSTTHRILQTLTELGYVRRDPDSGTYRAAIRLWELGAAMFANMDLPALASPAMERLLDDWRETVHLSVLDDAEVVYLHKLDSPEPVRAYSQVGGRAPAHCVATGKAILAFQDPVRLEALSRRLVAHSPRTITDPAAFLAEMARIRAEGHAVNRGEWRQTVHGLGAPVRDPHGRVIAGVGISMPAQRFEGNDLAAMAASVRRTADEIGAAIGGARGPAARSAPSAASTTP